ncbi:MAG TPA: histidinol-phosphatase [Alphaproteobacteria bacterium]|nr:histidinol-phosphatase [Alphaproteobacteria bacterium]
MSLPDLAPFVALAERLVMAGGEVVRRHFRTPVAVDQKGDLSPVTVADREAERSIREILVRERPEDGIYGEELGAERIDAEYVWVLDPTDGTKAFITGRPLFGTLIALLYRGRPVLGVIDQPVIGDRWIGAAGRPTLFNGSPARTRSCPQLDDALLNTTSPDIFTAEELERFDRVRRQVRITTYGGDCYGYGLVAAGFVDLVVEAGLKLYDFAALVPILEGAGGLLTDWQGRPLGIESAGQVVAAGDRRTHEAALKLLG